MRIDHVAIAVEDLESAVKQYVDAFGITDIEYETVESEKVKVAILKMENASIELMASTGDGPIKKFLDTRGSGLHHVALETPDIDGQVSKMESCGVGGVRPGSRRFLAVCGYWLSRNAHYDSCIQSHSLVYLQSSASIQNNQNILFC